MRTPISILIPTRNEIRNLRACLDAIHGWADEIVVVDSGSTDGTIELAESFDARVVQFRYAGGWPKKRNWALEHHAWRNEWILLLDADEILTEECKSEIARAIRSEAYDGYWIPFRIVFLGRLLRFGGTTLWKLCLFRAGKGRYEKRLEDQDPRMADMEVHEHVVVEGRVGKLRHPVRHENVNSLDRYIEKHNEYSNWEAAVYSNPDCGGLRPTLFGSQAQRRRWIRRWIMRLPGLPIAVFLYRYVLRGGFLDGRAGLIHAGFLAIQFFHVKAKIYERQLVQDGCLLARCKSGRHGGVTRAV